MPNRRGFLGALLGGLAALKLGPKAPPAEPKYLYLQPHPSRYVFVDVLTGREYPVGQAVWNGLHLNRTITWTHLPSGTRIAGPTR